MLPSTLLVGIGNTLRSDDAIGLWVAERIAEKNIPTLVVKTLQGEGTRLLDLWENFGRVFLIDAVSAGAKPGTCFFLTVEQISSFRRQCAPSSHLYSIFDAIELARVLKKLPSELIFCGVQVKSVAYGNSISEEVLAGARDVVSFLLKELGGSVKDGKSL